MVYKNDNECIICRENLVNDYALLSSDEEPLQVENIRIDNNLSFDDILKNTSMVVIFCRIIYYIFYLII